LTASLRSAASSNDEKLLFMLIKPFSLVEDNRNVKEDLNIEGDAPVKELIEFFKKQKALFLHKLKLIVQDDPKQTQISETLTPDCERKDTKRPRLSSVRKQQLQAPELRIHTCTYSPYSVTKEELRNPFIISLLRNHIIPGLLLPEEMTVKLQNLLTEYVKYSGNVQTDITTVKEREAKTNSILEQINFQLKSNWDIDKETKLNECARREGERFGKQLFINAI
jgi:hypothetical protein